ncbi:MAG: hypothetical protein WA131_12575 [Desulfitobacteriaceae bacterium]
MLKKFKKVITVVTCALFLFTGLGTANASIMDSTTTTAQVDNQQVLDKLSKSEDKLIDYLKANSDKKDIKLLIGDFFNKELKASEKFTVNELNSLNEFAKKNEKQKL